jgi:ABC-type multidrug transport system permease subunit
MSPFRMYWIRTFKHPANVIIWLSLPFLFMTLYTLVFGGSGGVPAATMLLIDRDDSFASGFVKRAFSADQLANLLQVEEVDSLRQVEERFEKGGASAALEIPEGFGRAVLAQKDVTVTLYTNPRHVFGPEIIESVSDILFSASNELLRLFDEPLKTIQAFQDRQAVTSEDVTGIATAVFNDFEGHPSLRSIASLKVNVVESGGEKAHEMNMGAFFFPGLVMFSLISLSLGVEARFQLDRIRKLNHRMITTPITPTALVLGQRSYAVVFLLFMGFVCGLLGGLIWRIPPQGMIKVVLLTLLLILCVVGINASIFNLAKTQRSASALSSFVLVFLVIVGGGFMPVEFYPAAVRRFSLLTPTGLASTGIVQTLNGGGFSISLPLLVAYAIAFMGLSIFLGARKFKHG